MWQVLVFLLGGGAALASHATKATTRAAVNTSPEPVSNIILSTAEDVVTGGLLVLAFAYPVAAALIALVLLALTIWGLFAAKRMLQKLFAPQPGPTPPQG